mmetsp:Transcript_20715/g.31350  ORF Transcript_20715/g.31350 Transcript_20715/m.31350 type:complete len:418 (-) Transcript_20715:1053-2306(-)
MQSITIVLVLLLLSNAHSFVVQYPNLHYHNPLRATDNDVDYETLLADIRSMRVKEIKKELQNLSISTSDVFEKEELVKRLYSARKNLPKATEKTQPTVNVSKDKEVIEGELIFFSQETGRSIPALNQETIRIEGVGQPYPAIKIRVDGSFDLTLLLDTACSGFVLRPSVVQQHNMKTLNTPVTMTGAGGAANAGLTQVERFTFGGESFGTLPAAVQDIGALPRDLDGIIGLSFLKQFALVEMDFQTGRLRLYKKEYQPPVPYGLEVMAEGKLTSTRLGIYTVEMVIDGRGPIKMLVDSGATSSFLSWQGATDLGLSKSMLQPLSGRIGAMGSDNIAMELTHTLPVEIFVNLGHETGYKGVGMTTPSNFSIDVGNIAILESQLKADRVVGIIGMDLLQLSSVIRISFNGSNPCFTLLK